MKNRKKIEKLINELRARINEINTVKNKEPLIINIFNWINNLEEFDKAINSLENLSQQRKLVLNEANKEFYNSIKNAWDKLKEIIKLNIDSIINKLKRDEEKRLIHLFQKENKYFLRIQYQLDENHGETVFLLDIYDSLRRLIRYLKDESDLDKNIKKMLKKFITYNDQGEIKEYLPKNVFDLYLKSINLNQQINDLEKNSPLEAFDYLKLYGQQNNWVWQLNKFVKNFNSDIFISKLFLISDYLYDYYTFGEIKTKKIYFSFLQEKLNEIDILEIIPTIKIKGIDGEGIKLLIGEGGEKGEICFKKASEEKYKGRTTTIELLKALINTENKSILKKDLLKLLPEEDTNINPYIKHINERFEKVWSKEKAKVFLIIKKEGEQFLLREYPYKYFSFSYKNSYKKNA
jgi:hypothetical protein